MRDDSFGIRAFFFTVLKVVVVAADFSRPDRRKNCIVTFVTGRKLSQLTSVVVVSSTPAVTGRKLSQLTSVVEVSSTPAVTGRKLSQLTSVAVVSSAPAVTGRKLSQ